MKLEDLATLIMEKAPGKLVEAVLSDYLPSRNITGDSDQTELFHRGTFLFLSSIGT